jgi:hypothetical protein
MLNSSIRTSGVSEPSDELSKPWLEPRASAQLPFIAITEIGVAWPESRHALRLPMKKTAQESLPVPFSFR